MAVVPPAWLRLNNGRALLTVHVQPGAKRSGVVGEYGDALKLRLAAPPVDGKANAALLEFCAARLGVARQQLSIKSGQSSRRKVIEVAGAPVDLVARLTPEN